MYDLDLWDKKILNALNADIRAPLTAIAKKARLSKEVVHYRINRLLEQGVIKEFVTIFGFGYTSYKILVELTQCRAQDYQKVISYLQKHSNINWLTICTGSKDLVFSLMAKTPQDFDVLLRTIMENIGTFVRNYEFGISTGSETYGHTYILNSIKDEKKKSVSTIPTFDEKDSLIANQILRNARIHMTDIAKKTNIAHDTISYRIKKMQECGIIKRYRMILDSSKIGYTRYEIFIRCSNLTDDVIAKFKEFGKTKPEIEFYSKCIGAWDVEYTVHVQTQDEFRKFLLEMKEKFGAHIVKMETITLFETLNYTYLPKELQIRKVSSE